MKALETLYSPAMVARSGSYSPSAEKPAAVVEDLLTSGISLSIQAPAPVTREDLCRAHDPAYVDGVLGLRRANGFGNRSAEVARSLLFTSGAMLAGARRAIERRVAFAPCSGFHHAGWMLGGGFCTFNGLMVTALALLDEGAAKRVAILDCDMHYGNGTDDILGRLGRPPSILHFTAGAKFHEASQASAFFEWLARAVEACAGCDVVLYQAGADPHVDDPLGGFLTTEELRERDARVFEGLARQSTPVVWNLAGGYRRRPDGSIPDVLEVHRGTALECARIFGIEISDTNDATVGLDVP